MALRRIIGYSHVQPGASINDANIDGLTTWLNSTGLNPVVKEDGWIGTTNAPHSDTIVQFSTAKNPFVGATKLYCGYQMRISEIHASASHGLIVLDSLINPWENPGRAVLSTFPVSSLPPHAKGDVFNINVCVDAVALTATFWVNDQIAYTTSISPAIGALVTSGKLVFAPFAARAGSNYRFDYRNAYINDDVEEPGNRLSGRLGAQRVVPIVIKDVSGENWTTNAASLKEAITGAPADEFYAQSPEEPTDLNVSIEPIELIGRESISGISLTASAKNSTSLMNSLAMSIYANGETSEPIVATGIDQTVKHGIKFGLHAEAPGNRSWSNSLLNQTVFKFRQGN